MEYKTQTLILMEHKTQLLILYGRQKYLLIILIHYGRYNKHEFYMEGTRKLINNINSIWKAQER